MYCGIHNIWATVLTFKELRCSQEVQLATCHHVNFESTILSFEEHCVELRTAQHAVEMRDRGSVPP
jgi:hypothetical protein